MIYFYSGTPGSGKSYHVAKDIYFQLAHGRNVIANFDINYDVVPGLDHCKVVPGKRPRHRKGYFVYRDNFELTVDWLLEFARLCHVTDKRGKIKEGQTWLVIDECQLIFNCRSWTDKGRMAWCNFFTQHRKYGYNVILVSQFDRLIDRAIRSLIEYEYKHRKINNFGTTGFLLGLFFLGHPVFCSVQYWYGIREKCGIDMFIGRKKYYRLYDSYKLFDAQA